MPNITRLPPMQATKKLMNSDNYYLNTQLMKFILRRLSLRNNLLSNESNVTHTKLLFSPDYMIMVVISFALVKFYAFAILYVLIVMQIKLVVVVVMWGKFTVNFRLVRAEVRLNFEPYFTHFPTAPPTLQVIIAQSLTGATLKLMTKQNLKIMSTFSPKYLSSSCWLLFRSESWSTAFLMYESKNNFHIVSGLAVMNWQLRNNWRTDKVSIHMTTLAFSDTFINKDHNFKR